MPIVKIPAEILRKVATVDGLSKAMSEFIKCQHKRITPPRVYKPSGLAKNGDVFEPYRQLGLWHHHLHRRGDPLLVTQHVNGEIIGVALTTHADFFFGDKMGWMQVHAESICWDGCDKLRDNVLLYKADEEPQPF